MMYASLSKATQFPVLDSDIGRADTGEPSWLGAKVGVCHYLLNANSLVFRPRIRPAVST